MLHRVLTRLGGCVASSASSSARSSGGARCLQRVVVHKRFASVLVPELDLNSEQAQADRASTSQLVAHLNKLHDAYRRGGASDKVQAKNPTKLFPRQRIELLLDEGSPFLELQLLAGHELYRDPVPAASLVCGVGRIHGQQVMLIVNDWTVKGGTFFPITVKKGLRAQEVAADNRLPCIYLADSGGAFLPLQSQMFADRDHGGRSFYNQANMSAAGIPQIAVAMGHCTAGGAYTPAMSDEVVILRDSGAIFLGGPPLVYAATKEVVTVADLGGAEMHTEVSGVADHFAVSEPEAMERVREAVEHLNTPDPNLGKIQLRTPVEPLYPADDLDALAVPPGSSDSATGATRWVPVREVLARLLDGSEFSEFKLRFGPDMVTGFGHLEGIPVGIVGNQGNISRAGAQKAAHFIEICNKRGIPLVFLQQGDSDSLGVDTSVDAEQRGVVKQLAKLMAAVACASVPKVTLVVGGSTGPSHLAMCGRSMSPRFLFLWPNAYIAATSKQEFETAAASAAEAKAEALEARAAALEGKGDKGAAAAEAMRGKASKIKASAPSVAQAQYSALYSSARCWDDGVVAPQETRATLALALQATLNAPLTRDGGFGVFRM